MGGYSTANIDGQEVSFGDICEVEIWDDTAQESRWVAVTFLEMSDDGDMAFRFVCDGHGVRGDDLIWDYYQECWGVRFVRKANDPTPDLGANI